MKNFFTFAATDNKNSLVPVRRALGDIVSTLASMPSILSVDVSIEGKMINKGVIEVEGKIQGSIKGGTVIIRESGRVEGKVDVDSMTIRGSFTGDLKAKIINIYKKAKIIGNIEYGSLSVEDGAYIDGQFKRLISNNNDNKNNEKNKKQSTDEPPSIQLTELPSKRSAELTPKQQPELHLQQTASTLQRIKN